MKWADFILRMLLNRRDRDAISGDLLEEYHEAVRPQRGAFAAGLWYMRQIVSFVTPVGWGVAIGSIAGTTMLVDTAVAPLADDTPLGLIIAMSLMSALWMCTAFGVARRTGRFGSALIGGMAVGITTMAVVHLAAIVRVNLFLEQIRHRDDWQNLILRFRASGFGSLRLYANYEYLRGSAAIVGIGGVGGAVTGTIAATIHRVTTAFIAH